jgi:hypothetical protein
MEYALNFVIFLDATPRLNDQADSMTSSSNDATSDAMSSAMRCVLRAEVIFWRVASLSLWVENSQKHIFNSLTHFLQNR